MKKIIFLMLLTVMLAGCGGGGGDGTATAAGNQVAVIGDSLSTHIVGYLEADSLASGGATLDDMVVKVVDSDLSGYQRIYIMGGINDIYRRSSTEEIMRTYDALLDAVAAKSRAVVFVQSTLPSNDILLNKDIQKLNRALQASAISRGMIYIDLWCLFMDIETGLLDARIAYDHVHLTEEGYANWAAYLRSL